MLATNITRQNTESYSNDQFVLTTSSSYIDLRHIKPGLRGNNDKRRCVATLGGQVKLQPPDEHDHRSKSKCNTTKSIKTADKVS